MNFFAFGLGFFPPLSISLADTSWAVFAVLWAIRIISKKERFHWIPTPMDKPILAFVLMDFLASFAGLNPAGSLKIVPHDWRFVIYYLLVLAASGRFIQSAFD